MAIKYCKGAYVTLKLGKQSIISSLLELNFFFIFCFFPTNIGIVRGTVSVATIVVVSTGVDI